MGRLGLKGLFDIIVLQLYSLVDHFGLEGHGEVFSPNIYLTQFECCELFWSLWEALEEAIDWWMQFGANCGIWITRDRKSVV